MGQLISLLVIVFHFSMVVSRLDRENKRLAQQVAFLANRLGEHEKESSDEKTDDTSSDQEETPVES